MTKQEFKNITSYIESNITRADYSRRGGGIEVDFSDYFGVESGCALMSAYANYLGGGMLGAVQSARNFTADDIQQDQTEIDKLHDILKQYFFHIVNDMVLDYDSWSASSYADNQIRPASAY